MSFEDLPETWPDLPLTDPLLAADVVDLFVAHADRVEGCAAFLLLDDDLRLAQPCLLGEVPEGADPWDLRDHLVTVFGGAGLGGVVFARGRDGSVLITDADRRWHEVLLDVCRRLDVRLTAAFVATPAAVRSYPGPLAAADHLAS
ncbi:hypothetical protein G7075_02030 [Phycicoccus sp. HDW14]|uniref:hypothetical protein n=1 Tax=Phycicoccus sp. HDW14 TaxID=2714941 RepID=UPI00140C519A|nr:hypothetical protein [Phycicoccus sp. HDW14]QIM20210.1 hypothetical protein G7075_02030 [Phycicoccus sp. HDW14]